MTNRVFRFSAVFTLVLVALVFLTPTASANMVFLGSQSTAVDPNQSNGMGPNLAVPPNPGWATALAGSVWVSYEQSGNPSAPGFVSPPNGTTVNFTDTFVLTGPNLVGILTVLADDTTSVTENGHLLQPAATTVGNTFGTCSDFPIGCLTLTEMSFNLSAYLVDGTNTLSFGVVQDAGSSYGLDFAGQAGNAVPEPATFGLMGISLLGLGLVGHRRFQERKRKQQ